MKTGLLPLPALAAALLGSGCMSFEVGDPTYASVEYKAETTFAKTLSREAADVAPSVSQDGDALRIGLRGSIETKTETEDVYREISVKRQKRMSFGLFPAADEAWRKPKGAMLPLQDMKIETDPATIARVKRQFPIDPLHQAVYEAPTGETYIAHSMIEDLPDLLGVLYTPWALLVTPFYGDWECRSHHWCFRAGVHNDFLAAYMKLPEAERRKLGINQCDSYSAGGRVAHAPWFGFHRYVNLYPRGPTLSRKEKSVRATRSPAVAVAGPYEIEVEIPAIGYKRRQGVLEGQTEEPFFLPSADRDMPADATIRFFPSPDGTVADKDQRAILEAVRGRNFTETIRLRAGEPR